MKQRVCLPSPLTVYFVHGAPPCQSREISYLRVHIKIVIELLLEGFLITVPNCKDANYSSVVVHGPEQISVPSGWAKLGNVFYVDICPVHYLGHDRPLKLAAFMWLSSIFNILFSKNSIFVFFDDFQIIFTFRPSSMTVLIKYNCCNTSWYPFELYVSISLKKCSNYDKFAQKFLPFHNQWKIWTASLHSILKL